MSVPIASKIGESESAEEFDALRATSDVSNVSGVGADEAANQAPVGPVRVNKHCTSLWFDDGNIVLSAPSDLTANLTVYFCVHAGVLCRHSQVFADMLAIPEGHRNSSSEGENYGGLPCVRMVDSSEDLEAFLKVLYDPWAFSKKHVKATLSRSTRFLAITDKYDVHGMKAFVQNTLEAEWPRSLEHWDLMDNRRCTLFAEGIMMLADVLPEPAAAVRLAKQYQIKSVFPAALYQLSRSNKGMKGAAAAAGAGAAGPQMPRGANSSGDVGTRWDLVPLDTLAALYKLRELTEDVGIALYDAFVCRKRSPGAFAGCANARCLFLDRATARFEDIGRSLADRRDVLKTLRILKATIKKELMGFRCDMLRPCGYNAAKIVEKLDSMRLEIWAKLEEFST